jgi:hypothetical protein
MTCLLWDTCVESGCGYYTCDYGCPASVGETCDPSCNVCNTGSYTDCGCPDVQQTA